MLRSLREAVFPAVIAWLALAAVAVAQSPTRTQTLAVPGNANPWLAGMPDGATLPAGDISPVQSPVLVDSALVASGALVRFSASGRVGNEPGVVVSQPDGNQDWIVSFNFPVPPGLSNIAAPINGLVGVFLPDEAHMSRMLTPETLDYRDVRQRNLASQFPKLGQVFYIGDGITENNAVVVFRAPLCAKRLFLGTMDGFAWNNNTGAFVVTVTSDLLESAGEGPNCS